MRIGAIHVLNFIRDNLTNSWGIESHFVFIVLGDRFDYE